MGLNSPIQLNRLVGRIPRKDRIILHKDNQDPILIPIRHLKNNSQMREKGHRCNPFRVIGKRIQSFT